ncbi:MAG: hypothetical protein ACYTJ0_10730 [Planctomycetota bacterium]
MAITMLAMPLAVAAAPTQRAQAADDPVLWLLKLEGAEMRLRHAEAERERRRLQAEWARALPIQEQVGALTVPEWGTPDRRWPVRRELEHCEHRLVEATAQVERRQLDLDEMQAAVRMPNLSIWAPLVDGRDFVTERMLIRLRVLKHALGQVKPRHETYTIMLDRRAVPWQEAAAVANELDELNAEIERVELEMTMRQRMLDGNLPPDANFVLQEAGLDRRQTLVENRLARVRRSLEDLEPLVVRGVISQFDVDDALDEVRSREQELERLDLERREFEYRYFKWLEAQAK